MLAAGVVLAAVTARSGETRMLVPCAVVLGCTYGRCRVAGQLEMQRLADAGTLADLTAAQRALTYVGFAAPCVLSLAVHVASYTPPSLGGRERVCARHRRAWWPVLRRRDRAV
jgi:hypothetical protein